MTIGQKGMTLAGLLLASVGSPVEGQAPALSGVVLREGSSDPLSGASIRLVEPGIETRSDEHGAFWFAPLPAGEYTLRATMPAHVSLIEPVSLLADETAYLQLSLAPIAGVLEEILAVVDGSSSRSQELVEVERGDPRTLADVLAERMPSLHLMRNEGSAGGGARVRVRGVNSLSLTNEPIILVDGIRIAARSEDRHSLEMIPASLVRRIRIFRGPSAQFPDATNGVISIETVEPAGTGR